MGDAIKMAIGSTEMGGWSTRLITINMNNNSECILTVNFDNTRNIPHIMF